MAISNINTDISCEEHSSGNSKINVIHRNYSLKTSLSKMNWKNCDSSRFSSSCNNKTCDKNINIPSDSSPNLIIKSSNCPNNNLQYVSNTDSSSDDDDGYNSNRFRNNYIISNSLTKKITTNINNIKTTTTSITPVNSNINTNLNDNIILSDSASDNEETSKVGFLVAKKISEQKKLLSSQTFSSHTKQFSEKNKKKSQKHRKNNKTASGSFTLHFSEPININKKSKSASSSSFAVTATSNPRDKNLNLSLESKKSIEGCTETTAVINAIINNVTCGNESNSNKTISNSDSCNNGSNNRDIKNLQLKNKSENNKYIEDTILNQSKNDDLINGQNNDNLLFSVNLTFSSLRPSLSSSTSNSEICENNRLSNSNTLYELNCIATNQPKILSGRIKNSTFSSTSVKSEITDEKLETETKTKFEDKEKQGNSNEIITTQTNLNEIRISSNDNPSLEMEKLLNYSKDFSTILQKNSEKDKELERIEVYNPEQQNEVTSEKLNLETLNIIEKNIKEIEILKLSTNENKNIDLQDNISLNLNLNKEVNLKETSDRQDIILAKNVKNTKFSIESVLNEQNSEKNIILCSNHVKELKNLNIENDNIISKTEKLLNKDTTFLENVQIIKQNYNQDATILNSSQNNNICNEKPDQTVNNSNESLKVTENTIQTNFSVQKKESSKVCDSNSTKSHCETEILPKYFDKSINAKEVKDQNEVKLVEDSKESIVAAVNIENGNVKLNSNKHGNFDLDKQDNMENENTIKMNITEKQNPDASSALKLEDKSKDLNRAVFVSLNAIPQVISNNLNTQEKNKTQKIKGQIKSRTELENKRSDKEIESIVKKLMERNPAFKKVQNIESKNTENNINNLWSLEKTKNTLKLKDNRNEAKKDKNINSECKNEKEVINEQTDIICPIKKDTLVSNNFDNCANLVIPDNNEKFLDKEDTNSSKKPFDKLSSEIFSKIEIVNKLENKFGFIPNSINTNEAENISKKISDINNSKDSSNSSQRSLILNAAKIRNSSDSLINNLTVPNENINNVQNPTNIISESNKTNIDPGIKINDEKNLKVNAQNDQNKFSIKNNYLKMESIKIISDKQEKISDKQIFENKEKGKVSVLNKENNCSINNENTTIESKTIKEFEKELTEQLIKDSTVYVKQETPNDSEINVENKITFMTKIFNCIEKRNSYNEKNETTKFENLNVISFNSADSTTQDVEKSEGVTEYNKCKQELNEHGKIEKVKSKIHTIVSESLVQDDLVSSKVKDSTVLNCSVVNNSVGPSNANKKENFQDIDKEIENSNVNNTFLEKLEIVSENKKHNSSTDKTDKMELLKKDIIEKEIKLQKSDLLPESISKNNLNTSTKISKKLSINEKELNNLKINTPIKQIIKCFPSNQENKFKLSDSEIFNPSIDEIPHFSETKINIVNTDSVTKTKILNNEGGPILNNAVSEAKVKELKNNIKPSESVNESITNNNHIEIQIINQSTNTTNKVINKSVQKVINQSSESNKDKNFDENLTENGEKLQKIDTQNENDVFSQRDENDFLIDNFKSSRKENKLSKKDDEKGKLIDNESLIEGAICDKNSINNNITRDKKDLIEFNTFGVKELGKQINKECNTDIKMNLIENSKSENTLTKNTEFVENFAKTKIMEKQKQNSYSSKKLISHSNNVSLNTADSTTIDSKNEKTYKYNDKEEFFEIECDKSQQILGNEQKNQEIKKIDNILHDVVAPFSTTSKLKNKNTDTEITSKHSDISNSSIIKIQIEKSKEIENDNILAEKNKSNAEICNEGSTPNLFSKRKKDISKVELPSINSSEIKKANKLDNCDDICDNKKIEPVKNGFKTIEKSEISKLVFKSDDNTATEVLRNVTVREKHDFKDHIPLNCNVEKISELKKSEIELIAVPPNLERSVNKSFHFIKTANKNIPENIESKVLNKSLYTQKEMMVKRKEKKLEEKVFISKESKSEVLNSSSEPLMVEEKIMFENPNETHKDLNISSKLFKENKNTNKNVLDLIKTTPDILISKNSPTNLIEVSMNTKILKKNEVSEFKSKNITQCDIKNSTDSEQDKEKINSVPQQISEVSQMPKNEAKIDEPVIVTLNNETKKEKITKTIRKICKNKETKENKRKEVDEYIVNNLDVEETILVHNSSDSENISQSSSSSENEGIKSQNICSEHSNKKRKIESFDKNNSFVNSNNSSESSNNSNVQINSRTTKLKIKPEIDKIASKSQPKISNKEIDIKFSKSMEIQKSKVCEKFSKSQNLTSKDSKALNKDEKRKHSKKDSKVKKEINDENSKSPSKSTFLKGIEILDIQNVKKSSTDLQKEKNKDIRFENKLTDPLTSQTAKSPYKNIPHEELSIYECLFQSPLKILKNEADSRSPAITEIIKINHGVKSSKTHTISNSSITKNVGEDLKEEKCVKKKEKKECNTSRKPGSDKDKSYRKENKSSSKIYKKDEAIKDVLDGSLSKPIKKTKTTKEITSTVKAEVSNKTKKIPANSQEIKSNVVRKIFQSQAKKDLKDGKDRIESEKNSHKAIVKKEKPQEIEKNKNESFHENESDKYEQSASCTTSKEENLVLNDEALPDPTPKSAVTILTWELMNDIVERSKKTNEVTSSSCSVDSSSKTHNIDSKSSKLKKSNKQSSSKQKRSNNTQQQQQQQQQQYTSNKAIDSSDKLNELNRIDEVTSSTEISSTTTFYVAAMNQNSDILNAEKNTPIKLRMKRLSRSMENKNGTECGIIESSDDKTETNCEKYMNPEISSKKCEDYNAERKKDRSKKRKLEEEETEPISKKCNLNNNDHITDSLETLNNGSTIKNKESLGKSKLIEKHRRKSRNSCNEFEKSIMTHNVENILHKSSTKNVRGKRGRPRNDDSSSISTDDNILSESEINDNFKNKINKEYKYEKIHTEIKQNKNENMEKIDTQDNCQEEFCNKKNDSITELIEENELKRLVETVKEFSKQMSNRVEVSVPENLNDKINVTTTTNDNSNLRQIFVTDKNDEQQFLGNKTIKTEKKRERKMSINSKSNLNLQELNENVQLKGDSYNLNHIANDKIFNELSSSNSKIPESMNCLVKVKRFSPEKLTRIVKENSEAINYFTNNQSNDSFNKIDKKSHLIENGLSPISNLNPILKIDADDRSKYSKENLSTIQEIQLFNKKLSYSRQDSEETPKVIIPQSSAKTEIIKNVDCYNSSVSNENSQQQIQTKRIADTYLNSKLIKKSLSPTIINSYSLTSDTIHQQINSNSNDLTINSNCNHVNDLEYFNPYEPAFLTDFDLADVWNLIPDDKNSVLHPIPEHLRKNSDLLEKKINLDGDAILTSIKVDREISNINIMNDNMQKNNKDFIENKKILSKDSKVLKTDEKNLKRLDKTCNNDKINIKNNNLSNNKVQQQQQKIKNPLLRPSQSIQVSQKKIINVQNSKLDNLIVNFCNPKLRSSPLKPIPTSSPAKSKNLQNSNTIITKIKSTVSDRIVGTQLPKKIPQFNEVIPKTQLINDFQSSYEHFARNAEFEELSFKPVSDKSIINTVTRKNAPLSKKSDAIVTSQQIILPASTSNEYARSSNNNKISEQKNSLLINNNSNLNSILKRPASQTLETMPINKKPKEPQKQLNLESKVGHISQTTTGTTGILIISEHLSPSTSINNDKTSNQYYTKHTQQSSNFLTPAATYKKRVTFSGDTKKK